MKHILLPSTGPEAWRILLADPAKHWKEGRSAYELAHAWEAAGPAPAEGLPAGLRAMLDGVPLLRGAKLLLAVPEHQVTLDTGVAPSQNDLWALLSNDQGLISMAVEGKAGELFDKTVQEWLERDVSRTGRENRLAWLCGQLGRTYDPLKDGGLRYQLFHRTVSALKEARRYHAKSAVMLVQTFCDDPDSWADYHRFTAWLGGVAERNALSPVILPGGPDLYLGWLRSECVSDKSVVVRDKSRNLTPALVPGIA